MEPQASDIVAGASNSASQLYDPVHAILAVACLSLLLTLIELPVKAKTRPTACFHWSTFLYFLISSLGYLAGTFLASSLVENRFPGWPLFWHVFFGVFAFHILIKHTNITMFDKGVLTIQDWVQKALEKAMAESLDKEAHQIQEAAIATAEKLRALPEPRLNTFVEQYLGSGSVEKLEIAARASNADPSHYKALDLALREPRGASAILKQLQKRVL